MNRDRRKVPGFHAFNAGNPIIVLGTRAGMSFAKTKRGALIAPIDLDPNSVEWPMQSIEPDAKLGRCIVVIAKGDVREFAARLAGALLRDGADRVLCIYDKGSTHHQRGTDDPDTNGRSP